MNSHELDLERVLDKAGNREPLSDREISLLLALDDQEQERLFRLARQMRESHFKNQIFLYGFVYYSTWCRNDCAFCYFRKSNQISERYRKSDEEILEAAGCLQESGVHLIDLTSGEDLHYAGPHLDFQPLVDLVARVKKEVGLPVMVSPGVVPEQVLTSLAEAGADWYACYQETHSRELFRRLRLGQNYDKRWQSKLTARRLGLLVEEGILAGVGETAQDLICSLRLMGKLGAQQIRVMSFVPQPGTPMEGVGYASRSTELKLIAIMRILYPDRLIPASLDVDGAAGLQSRINAGANVITSLIPPHAGLAGVAQCTKDINEGNRTVQGVLPFLEKMGLEAAPAAAYRSWVEEEKRRLNGLSQLAGGGI